jgi:hypothetical protein
MNIDLSSDVSGLGGDRGGCENPIRELTQPISCLPVSTIHPWTPRSEDAAAAD